MALIKIDELRPASSEFSADAEGYISELTEKELTISGGADANAGAGGASSAIDKAAGLFNTGDRNSLFNTGNININILGSQNN